MKDPQFTNLKTHLPRNLTNGSTSEIGRGVKLVYGKRGVRLGEE